MEMRITMVLDRLRSAHNTGNMFRIAEALGAEIAACGYTPCPPHPKLEKTAMGTDLTVPWRHFETAAEAVEFFHCRGIDRIDELYFTQSRTGTLGGLETLLRQMPVSLMVLPERDRYGWRFEEKCRALALQMPEIRWKESGGSVECDPAGTVFCRAPEIWRVDWQENGMKVCWNGREFYRQKNAGNRLECTIYE